MDFKELVKQTRSYRRFDQSYRIEEKTLLELVEYARLTPSSANQQPLRYIVSCSPEWNDKIFDTLGWAGYLSEWPGPTEGERPTGYVIILADHTMSEKAKTDLGIAAQTILLGAVSNRLSGCMVGNIRREGLKQRLSVPDNLEILLVIALGKPAETVVLEEVSQELPAEEAVKYYRTNNGTHHVPKRAFQNILLHSYS